MGSSELAAQAGGFPNRPLFAAGVAFADVATAGDLVGGLFVNPALTEATSRFAFSYSTHAETGLRGMGLLGSFNTLGFRSAVAAWSYQVAGLFDDELMRRDPSLSTLRVSSTGFGIFGAGGIGPVTLGAGLVGIGEQILLERSWRSLGSIGAKLNHGVVDIGVAGVAGVGGTRKLHLEEVRFGAMVSVGPARSLQARVGTDAVYPTSGTFAVSTGLEVRTGPISAIVGRFWMNSTMTAGGELRIGRFALAFAREFGSPEVIGGLTLMSVALLW